MFLTDFVSYKTFNDLKNYLYNSSCKNIELDYYYFNYQLVHGYDINNNNISSFIHITKYMEQDYTNKKYGYCMTHTRFIESFMSILRNFINKKDNLLDISNPLNLYFNDIHWYSDNKDLPINKDIFNKEIDNIPYADLYLISSRDNISNSAALSVELALALYLIRKYNSKVFIGGNHFNQNNNPIVNLINAVGHEYTNDKLEYVIGTIGINIFNYIKGTEYQNKWSPIETNIPVLNLSKNFLNILDNQFAIELIRGCQHNCPYCCNHIISKYNRVNIDVYKQWLIYLSDNYPDCCISLFAPELNTDKEYFINILKWIINNNIKTSFRFYVNLNYIDEEQIEYLSKISINDLRFSIDLLNDNTIYQEKLSYYVDKLLELKTGKTYIHIVTNVPNCTPTIYHYYKDIFHKYYKYLFWNEYHLYTCTDYFYNSQKYGINFLYYKCRYKELNLINKCIEQIPVMYWRNDLNRKELVNNEYDILNNLKKETFDIDNNNHHFIPSLIHQIAPDLDIVENPNNLLNVYVNNFVKNFIYKNYANKISYKELLKLLRKNK